MRPGELEHMPISESGNMTLFRRTRQRLQAISNGLGTDGKVYINGEVFNAVQFRFLLECLTPPKETP